LCSVLDFSYQAASSVREGEGDESAKVSSILSKYYMFKIYSCKNKVPF
jgi:hypothetical protein